MASDPISRARAKRDARKQAPSSDPAPALALVSGPRAPESRPVPILAQPTDPTDGHIPALSADLSADTLTPDTAHALSALVLEYDRLGTRIANLKASQDTLKSEIESICFEIPAKRISGRGWHTTRSKKPTTFIDKNKLAEKGVDPDVISYATTTKWSREFVLPVVEKEKVNKK